MLSDGLCIRFREMAPQQELLSLAFTHISALHQRWPETLQCNIVMSKAGSADEARFDVRVELKLGRRSLKLEAEAESHDPGEALGVAFGTLRTRIPLHGMPSNVRSRDEAGVQFRPTEAFLSA